MTRKEFLDELRHVAKNYCFLSGRSLRFLETKASNLRIMCPITAVCYLKTGEFHEQHRWWPAAHAVGLSHDDASEIALASDDWGLDRSDDRKRLRGALELAIDGGGNG